MAPGLPARVVVLCTVICTVTIARAERRPVVVIDLANEPKTVELAKALNPELTSHPDLQPVPDPTIPAELVGEFRDYDQEHYHDATLAKQAAEDYLRKFQLELAEASAASGQHDLEQAMPRSASLALYAQLAFVRGQALRGLPSRGGEASASFALAHRLDASFAPDPARYLPDLVGAYNAATKAWSGKATLVVAGTGRLWIDGKDSGTAPTDVEVAAGPHVVWLTGAERLTSAVRIVAEAGKKTKLDIRDAPADVRLKVQRARAQLRSAPDPAARAAAMKHLADLVGVRDAVLLTSVNGKVIVQTWNAGGSARAPGFSALRERKTETPLELLAPLAPPRPKVPDERPPVPSPRPEIVRAWYEHPPVQVGLVAATVTAIVVSYLIYTAATDDTVTWNPDVAPAGRIRW